jgi:ankyrin repeat protein
MPPLQPNAVMQGYFKKELNPLKERVLTAVYTNDYEEIINLIYNDNIDVNMVFRYREGATPLTLALRKDHIDIARLLLENGADLNKENPGGEYPIHMTMSPEGISLLAEYGADLYAPHPGYGMEYYQAIEENNPELWNAIIEARARVRRKKALGNFQRISRAARRTANSRQAQLEKISGRPLNSDVSRLIAQMSLNTSFGRRRITGEIKYLKSF